MWHAQTNQNIAWLIYRLFIAVAHICCCWLARSCHANLFDAPVDPGKSLVDFLEQFAIKCFRLAKCSVFSEFELKTKSPLQKSTFRFTVYMTEFCSHLVWKKEYSIPVKRKEIPLGLGLYILNEVFYIEHFYSVWTPKPNVIGLFCSM